MAAALKGRVSGGCVLAAVPRVPARLSHPGRVPERASPRSLHQRGLWLTGLPRATARTLHCPGHLACARCAAELGLGRWRAPTPGDRSPSSRSCEPGFQGFTSSS